MVEVEEEEEEDSDGNPIPRPAKVIEKEEVIDCTIVDCENGSYDCSYIMPDCCAVRVEILFFNDKEEWV